MRTATALVVFALLVVAIGCSAADTAPQTPSPAEEPVVDTFDQGLEDTTTDEDLSDLESLDSDLAAFE